MIPQRLRLKNFLSYRDASLNFQGLQTACVCGANGAGKSSLLEAISWAVWGESRAATEDDVIHLGADEALVDFIFVCNQQTYRILRSRQRGQSTTLEFQIAQRREGASVSNASESPGETEINEMEGDQAADRPPDFAPSHTKEKPDREFAFRSLTAKGVRATQQIILEHLRLDYETFINSAYLRQGRADEFMLKRPGERKQILADLLKLDQYDELAEQAKDRGRQLKGQIELLERTLAETQEQLQQRQAIAQELATVETQLTSLQAQYSQEQQQWRSLQSRQQQRQIWQQQLTWQQQQQQTWQQDWERLQQDLQALQQQQQGLETLIQQEGTITTNFQHFQALQVQEERLSNQFQVYQTVQAQRQQYQQRQAERLADLQSQIQPLQGQLESLAQQEEDIRQVLEQLPQVETALAHLHQARQRLTELDRLQTQVSPLLQRRQQVQSQLDRASARLVARLEELQASAQTLQAQQQRKPQLQQAVLDVSDRLDCLEQKRSYQQQILEKGLERRGFMEHLQAEQRNQERQLAEVEQKLHLLQPAQPSSSLPLLPSSPPLLLSSLCSYPPCPLCDRPLDEHHWTLVLDKHQAQKQEILEQLWVIREQLSVSEREIQLLRQEYRQLDQELTQYGSILERRGQLQEQLQVSTGVRATLEQLQAEVANLEQTLQSGNYAADSQEELRLIDQRLQELAYDEKDHALARGDVDRWRWAEIRQAEIKQAQRRLAQIDQQRPQIQTEIDQLQATLQLVQQETAQHLAQLDRQLAETGYNLEQHTTLRNALKQAQSWQLQYQELRQAKQHYPQVQKQIRDLTQSLHHRQQRLQESQTQIAALVRQLAAYPDSQGQMQQLEQRMQELRSQQDEGLAQLGRLQQQQQQLAAIDQQQVSLKRQLQTLQRQHRVYQELAQAFGRNGLQALMIENVLPQLEAETNHILSRLSANQLHVQFITQRSSRRDSSKLKTQSAKLIDTLDILIADTQGTRPYETYSGGEAFRVNFAIRLALAKLLAQRSGTALQLLIVDEGFGTQDAEGCDRLVAAINAISPDFACILVVTHMPHFKEAFQSRIEVNKTAAGSQVKLHV